MAQALPVKAFPVNTQGLYSAIESGTPLFNTPAVIGLGSTCVSNINTVIALIAVLDPTATDYTPSLTTALTTAKTALSTALTGLSTHVTHQISTAPVLLAQTIMAESIRITVNSSIGPDDLMLSLTSILRGASLATVFAPVNSNISIVTSRITALNPVMAASITTMTDSINTAASTITAQVAAEDSIEAGILNTVQSFGAANALISNKSDTGLQNLASSCGTSALNSHIS